MPGHGPRADLGSDFTGRVNMNCSPTPDGRRRFTLTSGVINAEAEAMFGRGYCHWLAGAINAITGWDMVTVDVRARTGEWLPTHTAVRTPAGRMLDIFGEHTKDDVFDRYLKGNVHEARMRTVTVENFPGDVLTDIDHLRGNPHWWAKAFSGPYQGVLLHFARLLLHKHDHAHHIRPAGRPRPIPPGEPHNVGISVRRLKTLTRTPVTGGKDTTMPSLPEIVAHLSAMTERVPLGLLEAAAQEEMPVSARQASHELSTLSGEVVQVLGDIGGSAEITNALAEAQAKLDMAAQAYGQVKMWLGDARDASARAQQAIVQAVAYHTR